MEIAKTLLKKVCLCADASADEEDLYLPGFHGPKAQSEYQYRESVDYGRRKIHSFPRQKGSLPPMLFAQTNNYQRHQVFEGGSIHGSGRGSSTGSSSYVTASMGYARSNVARSDSGIGSWRSRPATATWSSTNESLGGDYCIGPLCGIQ